MRTTHNLPFESSDHFRAPINDGYPWKGFRVGTVEGLYCEKERTYRILAIENKVPHNGHVEDVFQWFKASATRDGFPIVVMEVGNPIMARILIREGFMPVFGTRDFKWTVTADELVK